jgi:hypothetical protein
MPALLNSPRVWVPVLLLAAGVGLSFYAWSGPSDAMLVPRVVLTLWSVIALAITLTELSRSMPTRHWAFSPLPMLMVAVLIAAVAVASLGFLLPSLPLVALTLWLFRVRRPLPLVLGTALIGGGLWFLFHHVLLIRLPTLLPSGVL